MSGRPILQLVSDKKPKFEIGALGATANAMRQIEAHTGVSLYVLIPEILMRHVTGDWGEMDAHDKKVNDRAVKDGTRIMSAYDLPSYEDENSKLRVWIITEWDRSHTTILLPEDY